MLQKLFSLFVGALVICASSMSVLAQADEPQAIVSARGTVQVDKNLIFNAARSVNPNTELPAVFRWNFGDGMIDRGEEVAHSFDRPGTYDVELRMQVGNQSDEITFPVFVFEEVVLLVTDSLKQEETVAALELAAREENNLLAVARSYSAVPGVFAEESAVATAIAGQSESLMTTDTVILWTDGVLGLNGLTRFIQEFGSAVDLSDKNIVIIADGNLDSLAKIARGVFQTISPQEILITRTDALRELALYGVTTETTQSLAEQAIAYRVVDSGVEEFSITAPLSFFTNYLVGQGIPTAVLLLILMLPVIATIVAFFKQVVGVTTFGVYTPSIVVLSFLTIGLELGLVTLVVVVLVSAIVRKALRGYRMSYTPRMAFVLSSVALAMLLTIVLLTYLAPIIDRAAMSDLIAASIFPMLIISTLAEKFVSIQTEKGVRPAIRLLLEVTLVAVACYFIVGEWDAFRTLMLAHPELVFVFLAGNVALGKYTGLRLIEYARFKDVIHRAESEE